MVSKTFLALSLALLSSTSVGGTFLKEKGSQALLSFEEDEGPFETDQSVCLWAESKKVACGKVVKTGARKLILKFSARKKGFRFTNGMEIDIADSASRAPGSVGESRSEVRGGSGERTFDVSLGASAGLTYLYPTLMLQYALAKHFTIGVQPIWIGVSTSGTSLSAFGGQLALNLYFTENYEGLALQATGGFLSMSLTNSTGAINESLMPLLFGGSLQYRIGISSGFDIGAGAGVLMVSGDPINFNIGFTGLLPLFQGYAAYSF